MATSGNVKATFLGKIMPAKTATAATPAMLGGCGISRLATANKTSVAPINTLKLESLTLWIIVAARVSIQFYRSRQWCMYQLLRWQALRLHKTTSILDSQQPQLRLYS